jgi:hypothetical protein
MAKKRKKRRNPQRPGRPRQEQGAAAVATAEREVDGQQPASRRAERKEEARRERERRIRQARRRQRTRRLVRWGIVAGVAGGIAGAIYLAGSESREIKEKAAAAAVRVGATEVETEEGLPNAHKEPFGVGQGGVPAIGGNHTPGALPAEPKTYQQQPPEETAIHNLEHGYVIVYYADEGDNALDPDVVSALEDVVNDETEVMMSPYQGLAQPLYLVAWGARQAIDPPEDASADDVVLVTKAFIDEWKNGRFAPEAAAG